MSRGKRNAADFKSGNAVDHDAPGLNRQGSMHPNSVGLADARRRVPGERKAPKFAERDATQSGQRFLEGSDPRLKRQIAFCETAAGDVVSPTAGKDKKPSPEFEGGALIGGEAAVPFPIDDAGIRLLADFFLLLDEWDRDLRATSARVDTAGGQQ